MMASLIRRPSAFLWLAAFHGGGLYILTKGPLRVVSSLQAALLWALTDSSAVVRPEQKSELLFPRFPC